MKKSFSAFLLFCLFCAGGCAPHGGASGSFDALSEAYGADARILAERAAEELERRYAPAHTPVALDRAPGVFGDVLEQQLRADGFALAASGLGVRYTLDTLESHTLPLRGYVRVACSDGQMFSFTREIFKGTEPPDSEPPADRPPLETQLPDTAPEQPHGDAAGETPPAPMPAAPAPATVIPAVPVQASVSAVKKYPVRYRSTARAVARRNHVSPDDFSAWNKVKPDQALPKGLLVYLSDPREPGAPDTGRKTDGALVPASVPAAPPEKALSEFKSASLAGPAARQVTPAPLSASAPVAPASSPVSIAPVSGTTPAVPQPSSQWSITRGGMLRAQMENWAGAAGYSLVWNAQNDYEMKSSAIFTGVFIDAVKNFFAALQANGLALRVTIYQGNRVMEVSEH